MNVDTSQMQNYASFMEEKSGEIRRLCSELQEQVQLATQCMDQQSGRSAASRMSEYIEIIRSCTDIADEAVRRLVLSKRHIDDAGNVFGGR